MVSIVATEPFSLSMRRASEPVSCADVLQLDDLLGHQTGLFGRMRLDRRGHHVADARLQAAVQAAPEIPRIRRALRLADQRLYRQRLSLHRSLEHLIGKQR